MICGFLSGKVTRTDMWYENKTNTETLRSRPRLQIGSSDIPRPQLNFRELCLFRRRVVPGNPLQWC